MWACRDLYEIPMTALNGLIALSEVRVPALRYEKCCDLCQVRRANRWHRKDSPILSLQSPSSTRKTHPLLSLIIVHYLSRIIIHEVELRRGQLIQSLVAGK